MWETANKYLIMGLISFETLYQTMLLTMFFVIAKGWGIVRFYVLREEATHVTIALGSVYLHYSAFFVTIELSTMNKVVRVSEYHIDISELDFLALHSDATYVFPIPHMQILSTKYATATITFEVCEITIDTFAR